MRPNFARLATASLGDAARAFSLRARRRLTISPLVSPMILFEKCATFWDYALLLTYKLIQKVRNCLGSCFRLAARLAVRRPLPAAIMLAVVGDAGMARAIGPLAR
jgi:hypothetical protein